MSTNSIDTVVTSLQELTEEIATTVPFDRVKSLFRMPRRLQFNWPSFSMGNLKARIPVVQGGMGVGISLSRLASAVADAGGVGVIAANGIGLLEKDYYTDGRAANLRALRREIRSARARTDGIIGVNIMVALEDFHELLDVAIEERVDMVFMGAGLPIKGLPVEAMREAGVKAVPIVSSVRAAEMIFRMWKKIYKDVPDALVFEGPLAGGHLGFAKEQLDDPEVQLQAVVPELVEALIPFETEFSRKIPVIAGGGIYTGADVQEALDLGASAVQMGTRFVATEECDADEAFKQAYVECTPEQIGLIDSPVGMPGRAIRNDFIRAVEAGERPEFRCAWQCLASCKADKAKYCISVALNNARRGKLKHGFVFAGANAHRVEEIVPVAALVSELAEGYRVAAKATVAGRLEQLVNTISSLRENYEAARQSLAEVRERYELALEARIRSAKSAGSAGLKAMEAQYEATLVNVQELQFRLTTRLADSWAVIRRWSAGTAHSA